MTWRSPRSTLGVERKGRPHALVPRAEPWTEFWGILSLTRVHAHALALELADVIERYRAIEGGSVEVVVHAGAVRVATAP